MTIRIVTQIISGKVFNESEIGVTLLIELNLKSTGKESNNIRRCS